MQTLAEYHLQRNDGTRSMPVDRLVALTRKGTAWTPVELLRRRFAHCTKEPEKQLDLFYNGFGADWKPIKGRNAERWIFVHSDYPKFAEWVGYMSGFVSGFLTINEALASCMRTILKDSDRNRVYTLPLPVTGADYSSRYFNTRRNELVLGFSGRIQIDQKRLDRLEPFLGFLDRTGLSYRFELLGDGEFLPELKRRMAGNQKVVFHGHVEGPRYWDILGKWKYIVFLSDYEGLPVALLEALSAGVAPVYPDFHNGQDWVARLGQRFLYPPGDFAAAAKRILELEALPEGPLTQNATRTIQESLKDHSVEKYITAFSDWARHRAENPMSVASRAGPSTRAFPGYCPLWVYNRFYKRIQFGSI